MDEVRSILNSFRYIVRALRRSSRASERDFGVSTAQLFILKILKEHGSLSINELTAYSLTDQSSVSTVVTRLVERGLVKKQSSLADGRRVEVSLSRLGAQITQSISHTEQDAWIKAITAMAKEERENLARLLRVFVESAGLAGSEDTPELFFEDTSHITGQEMVRSTKKRGSK